MTQSKPENEIPTSELKTLEELRSKIDSLDEKLVTLFDQRAKLVFEVGKWKKKNNYEIFDQGREKKILNKVVSISRENISDDEVRNLFCRIIEYFRHIESAHNLIQEALSSKVIPEVGVFGFVGLGLIGGSTALALAKNFPKWKFLVFDPNLKNEEFENWNKARTKSKFQIVNLEQLQNVDYLFLAAPIDINCELGAKLAKRNKMILNLGSFQEDIKDVIGFHPLAGKEVSGYQEAQADLFYNKYICITHSEFLPKEAHSILKALANALGAEAFFTNNEVHNQSLAFSSHLIQILSMIYGLTLDKNDFHNKLPLIPATAKEFLRLTGSDFKMWEPIINKNEKAILKAISDFEKNLREVKATIASSHFDKLKDLFSYSHQVYKSLYQRKKVK